jgi:hypothetical protein
VELLREVFEQQYERKDNKEVVPVKEDATEVVRNPHDPDALWSAKSQAPQKKSWGALFYSLPATKNLDSSRITGYSRLFMGTDGR